MKKLLVALALAVAMIVPVFHSAPPQKKPVDAANYCYPWQGSCYWRWVQCGPYVYNMWAGFSCDKCGWCIA